MRIIGLMTGKRTERFGRLHVAGYKFALYDLDLLLKVLYFLR